MLAPSMLYPVCRHLMRSVTGPLDSQSTEPPDSQSEHRASRQSVWAQGLWTVSQSTEPQNSQSGQSVRAQNLKAQSLCQSTGPLDSQSLQTVSQSTGLPWHLLRNPIWECAKDTTYGCKALHLKITCSYVITLHRFVHCTYLEIKLCLRNMPQ